MFESVNQVYEAVWAELAKALRVVGRATVATDSFLRPNDATAYAAGDLVANDTVAGNVVPLTLDVAGATDLAAVLRRLRLTINGTGFFGTTVRAHLFRILPVPTVGDNGAFSVANGAGFTLAAPIDGYVGSVDIPLLTQGSDGHITGVGVPSTGAEITAMPADGLTVLYALLETRNAVAAPVALKTFTLAAEGLN